MTDRLIAEIIDAGRARWPAIAIAPEAVATYLARLDAPPRPPHLAEVYLACACSLGAPAALAELEREYLAAIPAQLQGLAVAHDDEDEVIQQLRARLFAAAPGEVPRIAGYGGRGPLGGWLRTSVVRIAIDLRRGRKPVTRACPERLGLLVAGQDPELAFLKAQHQEAFRDALHEALAALGERDRRLLRLHLVTGLSAVRIATIFQVHHSTASRWLAAASAAILADVRQRLTERLRLTPGEFESLVRLVRSQLDLSLARVLGEDAGDEPG